MKRISREFRKRDKHVQKMTRDGLVDKNLSTGEENRASQRGQDFNLQRREPQEPMRPTGGPERQPPSLLQQLRDHRQPSPLPADYRQTAPPAEATAAVPDPYIPGEELAALPMEAARPTERSHEALSHENPAGPTPRHPQQAAYEHQNTTATAQQAGEYTTPPAPVSVPYSAESTPVQHHKTTADATVIPDEQPEPEEPRQPGRLQFEHGPTPAPGSRPRRGAPNRQHGAKYHQKFTHDAAKPGKGTFPTGPPETRQGAENTPDTRHNTTANVDIIPAQAPEPQRPGRLRFEGEQRPSDAEPRQGAADRQHGTEYARKFAPDAAKPATGDAPTPEKPKRLQFAPDEQPLVPDKKLDALQRKADSAAAKLEKARDKLPTRSRIVARRTFDDAKGKAKTRLQLEKEVVPLGGGRKPPAPVQLGKEAGRMSRQQAAQEIHQEIAEVEKDNVGVEAAHKIEQAAEDAYHTAKSVRSAYRFIKERPYKRVATLEKRAAKANSKLNFHKAVKENPKLGGKALQRKARKKKLQREYAKQARQTAVKAAKKAGEAAANAVKAVVTMVRSHPAVIGIIAAILLLAAVIAGTVSSCTNMAASGLGAVLSSSFIAEDGEIDSAEAVYTEWETDLRLEIENVETDRPDYDEYNYDIGVIGHDPLALLAYLTAKFQAFSLADVLTELQSIFDAQYSLVYDADTETRYNDPGDANNDGDEEPYDWHILNVTLTVTPFLDVITPRMTAEETELYDLMMDTHGNRQYTISPFAFDWEPYITSHYGWRPDPFTGEKSFHTGIDMGVPIGTEVVSGHDGVVSLVTYGTEGYGYQVKIDGENALQTRYAHLSEIHVSVGQEVTKGMVIAKTGNTGNSTGPHLHYEVIVNGNYLNPLFFAQTSTE